MGETAIVSNEVSLFGMRGTYRLDIDNNEAILKPSIENAVVPIYGIFFISFIINMFIEFSVFMLFYKLFKFPKILLKGLVLGNILTLPIVWIASISLDISLLILEVAVVFVEFAIYFLVARDKNLSTLNLFLLSVLQNISSLFIGWFIMLTLSDYSVIPKLLKLMSF